MQLTVNLGRRSYPIRFEQGNIENMGLALKEAFPASSFALVTNNTIARLYADLLDKWRSILKCPVHEIPDGERYKTIETWSKILDFLLSSRLERSSIVIALGGGVVGDLAGFAAATFLRGVGYVQIPTTLLAMVDSSVGGKTAVDHPMGKNLIGAFHQPKTVFIDTAFLSTLPEREFISGYAELFKYAFIGGEEMFGFVASNHKAMIAKKAPELLEGIRRSVTIKAQIVEKDECETSGLRSLLNFGHTFAHALERYFGFSELLHGEAVWWGMQCAIACSRRCGLLERSDASKFDGMSELMPKPGLPEKVDPQKLYEMMFTDKKISGGVLRLVLPTAPGISEIRSGIPEHIVMSVLAETLG